MKCEPLLDYCGVDHSTDSARGIEMADRGSFFPP